MGARGSGIPHRDLLPPQRAERRQRGLRRAHEGRVLWEALAGPGVQRGHRPGRLVARRQGVPAVGLRGVLCERQEHGARRDVRGGGCRVWLLAGQANEEREGQLLQPRARAGCRPLRRREPAVLPRVGAQRENEVRAPALVGCGAMSQESGGQSRRFATEKSPRAAAAADFEPTLPRRRDSSRVAFSIDRFGPHRKARPDRKAASFPAISWQSTTCVPRALPARHATHSWTSYACKRASAQSAVRAFLP
mmetsp:Transcript_26813/g.75290  ORF Transcript_26813/g.75290 Transcript_26813/m.75290 type:complete len:249 (+) Transcript_26813:88-834(+)